MKKTKDEIIDNDYVGSEYITRAEANDLLEGGIQLRNPSTDHSTSMSDAAWAMLRSDAFTDIQAEYLKKAIMQAEYLHNYIKNQKELNELKKTKESIKTVEMHIKKALEALNKLPMKEDVYNQNTELFDVLNNFKTVIFKSSTTMISNYDNQITKDLIYCGIPITKVRNDLMPTLKEIIKGTL